GNTCIDSVKTNQDKAQIEGLLKFSVLYMGRREVDKRPVPTQMSGEMHFNENVYLSADAGDGYVTCKANIEDLTIKAINSRKLSVKAIITLTVTCEKLEDVKLLDNIEDNDNKNIQILRKELEYVQMPINTRDNLRVRDTFSIPGGKPDISEIIWNDIDVRGIDTRMTDEGLSVTGELNVFIMYLAADEMQSVQWYETNIPINGKLDISGTNPDMISYVDYQILNKSVEPREDMNGENRDITVEVVLDMDVKAYEERKVKTISDVYSPICELQNVEQKEHLRKLIMRNNTKCRVNGNVNVQEYANVLQICNCTAVAQIDDYETDEDGMMVSGALLTNIFYVTSDDNMPMGSVKSVIPFNCRLSLNMGQINDSKSEGLYKVKASVEQLNAIMTSSSQIEVKACVSIDAICFAEFEIGVINECEASDSQVIDYKRLPAMIGVICDGQMSMWDLAKKYHTTTDAIREGNSKLVEHLKDTDVVKCGEKLLLMRS
ncbi:MAG: DUF3794 domain-containing protein, partial [Lachnospira sp.]